MDNQQLWPQLSGPQNGQDFSFQTNNSQFKNLEEPIHLKDFASLASQRNIEQEFGILRSLTESQKHITNCVGQEQQYAHLNRYQDMRPFRHTLVQIQSDIKIQLGAITITPTNYINGNYLSTVFNENNAIIATQGPVDESILSFWNMLWFNNVKLIVMLCQLKDKRGVQCSTYWPQKVTQLIKVGDYEISNSFINPIGQMINLTQLKINNGKEERIINHVLWSGWPDFGVPQKEHWQEIVMLSDLMKAEVKQKNPVVVHCSAGIGRTGSLISCYQIVTILDFYEQYIENQVSQGRSINDVLNDPKLQLSIFSIVRRQREQRICLVMNKEQYSFVYQFAINRVVQLLKKY